MTTTRAGKKRIGARSSCLMDEETDRDGRTYEGEEEEQEEEDKSKEIKDEEQCGRGGRAIKRVCRIWANKNE